ncbi:MAG: autotransporter-associated beta strand repeat-containing protein, partial [Afipia sp.]|nr:autotransporter-associated beta strand repeat-containing protein [Afipia sp.]
MAGVRGGGHLFVVPTDRTVVRVCFARNFCAAAHRGSAEIRPVCDRSRLKRYQGILGLFAGVFFASIFFAVSLSAQTLNLNGNNQSVSDLNSFPTGVVNNGASIATLTITGPANENYSGIIANGSAVTALTYFNLSDGTLTLSGANTYTGGTIVVEGTLQGGVANAFGNNSAVTVGNGSTVTSAILDLGGFNQSIGS